MTDMQNGRAVIVDGEVYLREANGTLVPLLSSAGSGTQEMLTDEQITAAAENDLDAAPMSDADWAKADVVKPGKGSITIRIDQDVLDYYRAQPGRYQSHINAALRKAMETDRKAG